MKKNSTKIKNTGASGYTLIEVVITMFLTATVFVGVYALFAKAMNYDKEGQHEIIASELAQEGIEMIKNKKEKNEMDWAVWKPADGDVSNLSTFSGIGVSVDCNPSLTWDNNGANYSFDCDKSNTVMQYSKHDKKFMTGCSLNCVGPEFTRKCNVHTIHTNPVTLNADELRITCEVSWISGVLNSNVATDNKRTVKASLVLTDWER